MLSCDSPERQAGGHPFGVRIDFAMNSRLGVNVATDPDSNFTAPDGHVKTRETRRPAGLIGDPADYCSIVAKLSYNAEVLAIRSASLRLWDVPADPAHEQLRMDPTQPDATAMGASFSGAPTNPYLTRPSMYGVPGAFRVRADSWANPGAFMPWQVGMVATLDG